MMDERAVSADVLSIRDVGTWFVLAPAIGLVLIGVLFVVAPRAGAAIFGVAAPEGPGAAYLVAIGLRDITFGLYIVALALFATRRAVGLVLGLTTLIPIGDILIVASLRGLSSPGHLLLHALSGLYMAAACAWVLRGARS